MSDAVIELECWAEGRDADFARVFTALEENAAGELYEHLTKVAHKWCDDRDLAPEQLRRTTGRHVQLADVLNWYVEEELLTVVKIDGMVAFRPHQAVQAQWDQPRPAPSLVVVDDEPGMQRAAKADQ